jgi:hypothetical protein
MSLTDQTVKNSQSQSTGRSTKPLLAGEILLALAPFLFFPLAFLLTAIPLLSSSFVISQAFSLGLMLIMVVGLFIALTVGWMRDFPRWVFPYWGFSLTVMIYMVNFRGTIAGYSFRGSPRLWLVLLGVAVIATLWTHGVQPVLRLLRSLWQDWSLLSFAVYGCLPLMVVYAYDEARSNWLAQVVIWLVLASGVVQYLRADHPWQRFGWLLGAFVLSWGIAMLNLGYYWSHTVLPGMSGPVPWIDTLRWMGRFGILLLIYLGAPLLVGLASRAAQTPKAA